MPAVISRLDAAVEILYLARKHRIAHPIGKTDFSSGERWYPSDLEDADVYTASIRPPSRNFPFSYAHAARTRKHIRALANEVPEFVIEQASKVQREKLLDVEQEKAKSLYEVFEAAESVS